MLNRRRFLQALGLSAVAAPLVRAVEAVPSTPTVEAVAADAELSAEWDNPHCVTKGQLGLYATNAEAAAGTFHSHYMTPLRMAEYVKANLKAETLVAPMRALPQYMG